MNGCFIGVHWGEIVIWHWVIIEVVKMQLKKEKVNKNQYSVFNQYFVQLLCLFLTRLAPVSFFKL